MSRKRRSQTGRSRPSKHSARAGSPPSLLLPIVVGVLLIAIVVGAIVLALEKRKSTAEAAPIALSIPVVTVQPQPTLSIPYPAVPRIPLAEAKELLDSGQAILVDVRNKESYDQGHAAGAISMPEAEILTRLSELPRDKLLILY